MIYTYLLDCSECIEPDHPDEPAEPDQSHEPVKPLGTTAAGREPVNRPVTTR